jgi:hypothetical protein
MPLTDDHSPTGGSETPTADASPGTSVRIEKSRSCAYCDSIFKPKRAAQIYCSTSCRVRGKALNRQISKPDLTDRRCTWCGNRLDSTNPKARFCSSGCRLAAFKAKPCIYCGAAATTRDHFIPKAFASRCEDFAKIPKRNLKVPACAECNSTAGAEVFLTLREKRRYIAGQYGKKYKKLLEAPHWTTEEIEELGPTLQSHIKTDQAVKDYMRARMRRLRR